MSHHMMTNIQTWLPQDGLGIESQSQTPASSNVSMSQHLGNGQLDQSVRTRLPDIGSLMQHEQTAAMNQKFPILTAFPSINPISSVDQNSAQFRGHRNESNTKNCSAAFSRTDKECNEHIPYINNDKEEYSKSTYQSKGSNGSEAPTSITDSPNDCEINESYRQTHTLQAMNEPTMMDFAMKDTRHGKQKLTYEFLMSQNLKGFIINPMALGFLPTDYWTPVNTPLIDILLQFFRSRSTKKLKFEHKLWNALVLSQVYPNLYPIIGVCWASNTVIKVNRELYGSLINVARPSSSLFNMQGSFVTHGFREIYKNEAIKYGVSLDALTDVDECIVRLFIHNDRHFRATATRDEVSLCKWTQY